MNAIRKWITMLRQAIIDICLLKKGNVQSATALMERRLNNLLLNRPKELCLSCHERIVTTTVRKGHIEMEKGDCLSCHVSHYSESRYLTNAKDPALCIQCHSIDTANLLKVHIKPIAKINHCLPCHEPHVTEKPGLLRKIKHNPFAKGIVRSVMNKQRAKSKECKAKLKVHKIYAICYMLRTLMLFALLLFGLVLPMLRAILRKKCLISAISAI